MAQAEVVDGHCLPRGAGIEVGRTHADAAPALKTARSIGPSVRSIAAAVDATAARSVTSRGNAVMLGSAAVNSVRASPLRAEAATLTPLRARRTAIARPMPLLVPVIQATRQLSAIAPWLVVGHSMWDANQVGLDLGLAALELLFSVSAELALFSSGGGGSGSG